jgi:hypothetical protein
MSPIKKENRTHMVQQKKNILAHRRAATCKTNCGCEKMEIGDARLGQKRSK